MGYKMMELIKRVELDPKSSTTPGILRHLGKSASSIKIKIKEKSK